MVPSKLEHFINLFRSKLSSQQSVHVEMLFHSVLNITVRFTDAVLYYLTNYLDDFFLKFGNSL